MKVQSDQTPRPLQLLADLGREVLVELRATSGLTGWQGPCLPAKSQRVGALSLWAVTWPTPNESCRSGIESCSLRKLHVRNRLARRSDHSSYPKRHRLGPRRCIRRCVGVVKLRANLTIGAKDPWLVAGH